MCISKIFKKKPKKITTELMESATIEKTCRDLFRENASDTQFLFPDDHLNVVSKGQLIKFLKDDTLDARKYIKEVFDCDDFAAVIFGRSREKFGSCNIGIIWYETREGGGHAENIYYDTDDKKIRIVEPQTDEIHDYDGKKVYAVIF